MPSPPVHPPPGRDQARHHVHQAYDSDRKRAFDLGANGYFVKPLHPAAFVAELERIVAETLVMTFWGVRGTLPVSRRDSVRYGGNTSCVSLAFPDGRLLVFDAGTGIKALGDALTAARRSRIDGRILISHPHWDHINALPFFTPSTPRATSSRSAGRPTARPRCAT